MGPENGPIISRTPLKRGKIKAIRPIRPIRSIRPIRPIRPIRQLGQNNLIVIDITFSSVF